MTPEQHDLIHKLSRCTFLPGSYEKRFVRDLSSCPPEQELTEKQARFLLKVGWRYRRQLIKKFGEAPVKWRPGYDSPPVPTSKMGFKPKNDPPPEDIRGPEQPDGPHQLPLF